MALIPPTPEAPPPPSLSWRPVIVVLLAMVLVMSGRVVHNRYYCNPSQKVGSLKLNINQADVADLRQLPAIGTKRAEAIVEHRSHYPLNSIEDLTRVRGIGPSTVAKIQDHITFSPVPTQPDELVRKPQPLPPTGMPSKIKPGEPKINVNTASEQELQRLPGIGPTISSRIVQCREAEKFRNIDDLRRVKGIGVKTLENLRPFVCVE